MSSNLLMQCSQVGMATNIPPHNLGELVDALSVLIHNPEATVCSTQALNVWLCTRAVCLRLDNAT